MIRIARELDADPWLPTFPVACSSRCCAQPQDAGKEFAQLLRSVDPRLLIRDLDAQGLSQDDLEQAIADGKRGGGGPDSAKHEKTRAIFNQILRQHLSPANLERMKSIIRGDADDPLSEHIKSVVRGDEAALANIDPALAQAAEEASQLEAKLTKHIQALEIAKKRLKEHTEATMKMLDR
eukprot:TRINITY_DN5852_c0_g2_i1.p1 TRINITY_DN5852_c0_g2~~TRINITY_DN5852_c0_g2_i1.p1  ORF type:complete len:180 (+),score=37.24 TRINITY_DN5852_c0_g2_i1:108-647(+)